MHGDVETGPDAHQNRHQFCSTLTVSGLTGQDALAPDSSQQDSLCLAFRIGSPLQSPGILSGRDTMGSISPEASHGDAVDPSMISSTDPPDSGPGANQQRHDNTFPPDNGTPAEGMEILNVADPGSLGSTTSTLEPVHHQHGSEYTPSFSRQGGSHVAGNSASTDTRPLSLDSLALERQFLASKGYSDRVLSTLLSSRRTSTNKIYARTWKRFSSWCVDKGFRADRPGVAQVLEFLQDGVDMGLSTNTVKRHLATISSIVGKRRSGYLSRHPDCKRFIQSLKLNNPPAIHRFPTWDLHFVLKVMMGPPFEPLATVPVKFLTLKSVFLVAITSARRVSELGALSSNPNLCMFEEDRVMLRMDPAFMPKINSVFHRSQDLILPTLCPNPQSSKERAWHSLDVKRALKFYLERTKAVRRSEALFVLFGGVSKGKKASLASISRWVKSAIIEAYKAVGRDPPGGSQAHSTRGAATSAVYEGCPSLETICRAATWASPNTFIRHYKIDKAASAEAAFGRRVLQAALDP